MGTLSGYYSSVQKILSKVTSNTLKLFCEKRTDEDRIEFALTLDFIDNAFEIKPQFGGKSLPESKRLRERGNGYYQAKNYEEALQWYTRSILVAPRLANEDEKSSDEMVLALGNRSATLFQLKYYRECMRDIEIAILYGYPKHLQYKLYDRRGRCLIEMGECGLAISALEKVVEVLEFSTLDEKQRETAIANAKKQIEECRTMEVSDILEKAAGRELDSPPPKTTREPSNRFPAASRDFDVKYSPEKGRYGFAVTDVSVGDIVMCEKPYVCVLDPTSYVNRCYHCFAALFIPIGCHQCSAVRFCSEACRMESWALYHHDECCFLGVLQTSSTGSISHLALRIILVTGLQRIIRHKKNPNSNSSEAQKSLFTDSKGVYRGAYVGLYNLLTHTGRRGKNDLLQYTILAVYILKILEKTTFFENEVTENIDDKKVRIILGGTILRFLQIISSNGVEIMELNVGSNLTKSGMDVVGLGLFPTVSLLNHSCDPTCELIFYRNHIAVQAIKNISAGRELTIDYGYIYYVTPKRPRQLSLESQYFFTCNCIACVQNWGQTKQLKSDIPILKCVRCGMPLYLFGGEIKDPTKTPCPNRACVFVQNPMDYYDSLQTSSRPFECAVIAARNWHVSDALPALEKHLSLMDKYVCLPWKDYATCISTLKQIYRLRGNTNRHWCKQNFPDIQ